MPKSNAYFICHDHKGKTNQKFILKLFLMIVVVAANITLENGVKICYEYVSLTSSPSTIM